MYVNPKNLFKLGNPVNVLILLLAKQATTKNDMSEYIASLVSDDQELDKLIEEDYLKKIKGTKKLNEFQKIRLGKKGTKFLNDLDEPDVEEQDITIFNWLKNIYLKRGKTVGNGKRTQ